MPYIFTWTETTKKKNYFMLCLLRMPTAKNYAGIISECEYLILLTAVFFLRILKL